MRKLTGEIVCRQRFESGNCSSFDLNAFEYSDLCWDVLTDIDNVLAGANITIGDTAAVDPGINPCKWECNMRQFDVLRLIAY